jgi:Tol biopolymer transport system component/DNA-binding winged helix-turn-helix (wHTH) protein
MPENQTSGRIYRFDEYSVLADERMVLRGNERIHLTPRVFHLLLILVENAGRLVSKETLLSEIWQDSFVEEGNLNSTVSRLRKILGETPDEKKYIETIPRVGYRFIANVELVPDEAEVHVPVVSTIASPDPESRHDIEDAEIDGTDPTTKSRRRIWLIIPAAALALIVTIGAVWYVTQRPKVAAAPPSQKNVPVRLTTDSANEQRGTWTPDGRIRFERMQGKESFSYIMNADGSDAHRDTSIPGMRIGLWSPDGKRVIYYKEGDTSGDQFLANADGSGESKLPFFAWNMDWSPDGTKLVYQYGRPNSNLYVYTFDTGKIDTVVGDPSFDADPSFSPDGKRIAFVSGRDGNAEIYTQNVDGSDLRRITDHPARDAFPTFSPDGTQIVFNSNREEENLDVYIMNVDGSDVRRLTNWLSDEESFPGTWSADGSQIFFTSTQSGKSNIYTMNVEPFAPTAVLPNPTENIHFPSYSPDGSRMLFQIANDDNTGEVRVMDVETKKISNVTHTHTTDGYPKFSPDGSSIVFQDRINGNSEICLIVADGSGGVQDLTSDPARDVKPAWSPDGSKIVFSSNRDGNYELFQLYIMNADGSNQHRIYSSNAMSVDASWSPDGREIVFSNDKEGDGTGNFEVFAIEPETTTAERRLTYRRGYDIYPVFSPDGKRVAFVSKADGNFEIYVMNSDGSRVIRLTREASDDTEPSWSPDGTKIVFSSAREGNSAIYELTVPQ